MRELKDGIRSLVKIDLYGNVHKYFRGTDADKRAANEAHILELLEERGAENVPRLLQYKAEENYIITTNCGSPAPHLSKARADVLFDELREKYHILHDDPEPRNITYDDRSGRFCIIDFELSTDLENNPVEAASSSQSPQNQLPTITWEADSTCGTKSPVNDDSWLVLEASPNHSKRITDNGSRSLQETDLILAISDGMGGGNTGDLASKLTCRIMARLVPEAMRLVAQGHAPDYPSQLKKAIGTIHRAINRTARHKEGSKGMGATLTLIWFTPEQLHLAHIGDSRLYLHREGETTQLSEDHTFAWQAKQRGELSEYQYRAHPRRSALYKAIGAGHRSASPFIESYSYKKGDRFLLCSDGLVDGLWEKVIHNLFDENSHSTKLPAAAFMTAAVESDGRDDTTLIAITVT